MKPKKFGTTQIKRRVLKRRVGNNASRVSEKVEVYEFLSREEAGAVKLPPKSFKPVKAKTNMDYSVVAPANIIRQHMKHDIMEDMGRIVSWRWLTDAEKSEAYL